MILFLILDVSPPIMPDTAAQPTAHTYSTSNTPPLTTHLALNVCEALRGQCPCDEYRDDTRNDRFSHVSTCSRCTSDRFSQRPLHRATNVWSQRPWTNALGGLYLSCLNRMLGRRWIDGRDEALRWYTSDDEKVAGGFPRPREGFSLQREVALYRISLRASSYRGRLSTFPTLAICSPNFRSWQDLFLLYRSRVVFILK